MFINNASTNVDCCFVIQCGGLLAPGPKQPMDLANTVCVVGSGCFGHASMANIRHRYGKKNTAISKQNGTYRSPNGNVGMLMGQGSTGSRWSDGLTNC